MSHAVDGHLATWADVESKKAWNALLLGNGFSTHLWSDFRYRSLFHNACGAGYLDGLAKDLFDRFDTENFERVLSALATAIEVAETLGDETDHLYERYTNIQVALGETVSDVHPPLEIIRRATREAVRATLREHQFVFTTSYDLLLYWCTGAGENGHESFEGFKDRFWSHGNLEFDAANARILESSSTQFLHLHGALHLAVSGSGVTRKRARGVWSLLEQLALPPSEDLHERPLLISEGEAIDKLRAIQENDYLLFALRCLRRCKVPMVVFGHSLGAQDRHLVDALNRKPDRPLAVSIHDDGKVDIRARKAALRQALKTNDLYFFDAATHPLGSSSHRIVPPEEWDAHAAGETGQRRL